MPTKKESAQHFLKLAAEGKSREAFKLYVGKQFKHHNVYFKGDANTLMIAIEEDAKINPDKIQIRKLRQGIDFVGYVILPDAVILRTKTKKRIFKKARIY